MKKITILLVDDNASWSAGFKEWFELLQSFRVETEEFGVVTLERVAECHPDIVILDRALANDANFGAAGDGIALAHRLRNRIVDGKPLYSGPILVASSWFSEEEAEEFEANEKMNHIFYCAKLVGNRGILAKIKKILRISDER